MNRKEFGDMFREKVASELIKQSINKADLARKSGLAASTITEYMHGDKVPSLLNAAKIASVLGFSLSEFDVENRGR